MDLNHDTTNLRGSKDQVKSMENLCGLKKQENYLLEKGSVEMIRRDLCRIEKLQGDREFGKKEEDHMKTGRSHSDFGASEVTSRRPDYDALSKDLADIEERLRVTRMGWAGGVDSGGSDFGGEIVTRRSQSLMEMESVGRSAVGPEKLAGHGEGMGSPAVSESMLKWDYGADIGLNQAESEEFEAVTWPVTAEQAMREAQQHADGKGLPNRSMKTSLSQGSFLSSPDPEDRKNLIAKSTGNAFFQAPSTGEYDETSARAIMNQAEEAERRLRQRLETVKSLHSNSSSSHKNDNSKDASESKSFADKSSKPPLVPDKGQKKDDEPQPEISKQVYVDDRSKSPNSVSNHTGRTTTMESTHTLSDYCKAPQFTPDVYGSRDDRGRSNPSGVYSRTSKEPSRSGESSRRWCGMAPELDTISSRETLAITDDATRPPGHPSTDSRRVITLPLAPGLEDPARENVVESDKDERQEHNLQTKWDKFRSIMKEDEVSPLLERTTIRSAVQYGQSQPLTSARQLSTATTTATFTSVTRMSPRHDLEQLGSPVSDYRQHNHGRERVQPLKDAEVNAAKEHKGGVPRRQHQPQYYQKHQPRQEEARHASHGSPGSPYRRRLVNGSGGGGGDEDDDEDDDRGANDWGRRKERHRAAAAAAGVGSSRRRLEYGAGGETTASELEHDDDEVDVGGRRRTAETGSSSVDTVMLMDRMAGLLARDKDRKSPTVAAVGHSRSEPRRHHRPQKQQQQHLSQPEPAAVDSNSSNRLVGADSARLVLKHLLLKHKVKWLAECAREEARRRKIRKLEKLIDVHQIGKKVIIPADLETDTASIMGSGPGSNRDDEMEMSLSDSWSCHERPPDIPASSHMPPPPPPGYDKLQHGVVDDRAVSPMLQNSNARRRGPPSPEPASFRQQYYDYRQSVTAPPQSSGRRVSRLPAKAKQHKSRKNFPPSESWQIPLRCPEDSFKEPGLDCECDPMPYSDEEQCVTPVGRKERHHRQQQKLRSQHKQVNLSARERLQLIRELEMARRRNAHECQKDMRHTKTGQTRIGNGGLAWIVGSGNGRKESIPLEEVSDDSDSPNANKRKRKNSGENGKVRQSELQTVFQSRMRDFISRSRQRQKRIRIAADERRYETQMSQERARLFLTAPQKLQGVPSPAASLGTRRRPVTQPDPLSENLYKPHRRRFSKSEMKSTSARKYQNLPEIQQKYTDERRRARMQNNRMKMMLYGEKVLRRVLRSRGPWVEEKT